MLHGLVTGNRVGLQDLTGFVNQMVLAYEILRPGCRFSRVGNNRSNMTTQYQDGAARSHEFGTPDSTCLEHIRTGLQISRVRNIRSYMPTRYQGGTA